MVGNDSGGEWLNDICRWWGRSRITSSTVNGISGRGIGGVGTLVNGIFIAIVSGGRWRNDGNARTTEAAVLDQLESNRRLSTASGTADYDTTSTAVGRWRANGGGSSGSRSDGIQLWIGLGIERRRWEQMIGEFTEYPRTAPKELRFDILRLLLRHLEKDWLQGKQRRPELSEPNCY